MLDISTLTPVSWLWSVCHCISYILNKLWIRHLKQIRSLSSSTNVNFFFPDLGGQLAIQPLNMCSVSTSAAAAASLWAKSLNLTVSLHWHFVAWLTCTWIHVIFFLIYAYSFFPLDVTTSFLQINILCTLSNQTVQRTAVHPFYSLIQLWRAF